nr:odorant receptor 42 [Achelura yunnanensis]
MWELVKKFGLECCDLPTMIWNISATLRILCVNIDRRNKSIPVAFYIFTGFIGISYWYVYGVSNIWFVFWRCRETKDLQTATIFLSIQLASEFGPLRMMFMIYYKSKIMDIVEKYLEYDSLVKSGNTSAALLKRLRTVKKRALIFWFIIVGNGLGYLIKPLLLPGKRFIEDDQVIFGLEPLYDSPNYEIAYILTAGGIIFVLFTTAHTTAFFIVLIGYTEAQLCTMSENLMCLWDDAKTYCNEHPNSFNLNKARYVNKNKDEEITSKMLNRFVKKRLDEIIKKHTFNIDLIKQIEETFRACIVLEYMLLTTALVAVLLGGLENTYIELPFSLLLVSVNCFMGQKLMNASETFSEAVYGCRWENFDIGNMKKNTYNFDKCPETFDLDCGWDQGVELRVFGFDY